MGSFDRGKPRPARSSGPSRGVSNGAEADLSTPRGGELSQGTYYRILRLPAAFGTLGQQLVVALLVHRRLAG